MNVIVNSRTPAPPTPVTQQRSARVLVTLLGADLPAACWDISAVLPDRLDGMLPEDDRAGLTQWAAAFGADIDWQRHGGRYPRTTFTINEVTVNVWAPMADTQATPTVATGQAGNPTSIPDDTTQACPEIAHHPERASDGGGRS
ncbi:hypothetical protein [Nocardiopsis rhodophaea]|uniref:hypothetical protein n=1 Tax=Nocardiopsis rhodophaea TaxID=280238 RepID=UPI0031D54407